jgi:hypothetical protein
MSLSQRPPWDSSWAARRDEIQLKSLGAPGLREAWDRGEREQFLVSPVEGEAIRYTEGTEVGVKR